MTYKDLVREDTTGTVKNMLILVVLYAITGCVAGASFVFLTSCTGFKPIVKDVGPRVIELTAEECVKIATEQKKPELAALCATAEDLAPFLDLIFAQQQKRLARQGDGGAPPAPSATEPAPALSCPPPVAPPPCSAATPAPPASSAPPPAPAASAPPLRGRK